MEAMPRPLDSRMLLVLDSLVGYEHYSHSCMFFHLACSYNKGCFQIIQLIMFFSLMIVMFLCISILGSTPIQIPGLPPEFMQAIVNQVTQQAMAMANAAAAAGQHTPNTAGTGPAPADTGPAPAGTGPAPAGTGPTPSSTGPAPASTGPAPASAGPAPASSGPTPAGTGPTPPPFPPHPHQARFVFTLPSFPNRMASPSFTTRGTTINVRTAVPPMMGQHQGQVSTLTSSES